MGTRIARNVIAVIAVLAAALSASPARADHDHDRGEQREGWRGEWVPPRPPAVVVAPIVVRPSPPLYAPAPSAYAIPSWRVARWNAERRFGELRHEYRELELARQHFYVTWDGRPWARDRFEAWYASRRADLDARSAELSRWRR